MEHIRTVNDIIVGVMIHNLYLFTSRAGFVVTGDMAAFVLFYFDLFLMVYPRQSFNYHNYPVFESISFIIWEYIVDSFSAAVLFSSFWGRWSVLQNRNKHLKYFFLTRN